MAVKDSIVWLEKVEEFIFDGKFNDASTHILLGLEDLAKVAKDFKQQDLTVFNKIMTELVEAFSKSDFLMFADLLEFKLKPLLNMLLDSEV